MKTIMKSVETHKIMKIRVIKAVRERKMYQLDESTLSFPENVFPLKSLLMCHCVICKRG